MRFLLTLLMFVATQAQATPSPALADLVKRSYDPHITFFHSVEKQSVRKCPQGRTFVTGKDPFGSKRDIEIMEYEAPGATRAVIIMPPTGGETIIDQQWANVFCAAGLRTVIVRSFELFPESGVPLTMYDHTAITSLVAIRQTVDYLYATGSKSVGIFGESLGALEASFAVVLDDRLKVATFVVGGLGLADIAATSEEETQAQLRDIRKKMWNMNQEQYAAALKNAVHIDVGPFIDPTLAQRKKVLSIIALDDTFVPTAAQMRLYQAFGSQEVITLQRQHVETVIRTCLLHSMEVLQFFESHL